MKPSKQRILVGAVMAHAWAWAASDALAEPSWDACAQLQRADVEAAFSPRTFDAGTPGKAMFKSSPTLAAVSKCTYTSAGATVKDRVTVSLLARRAPSDASGVTPQAARAGALQLKATPVEVAGLGEGAYAVNLGSAAFPVLELNVFRGKRVWLVFACAGPQLDQKLALAALTKIASASAARQ